MEGRAIARPSAFLNMRTLLLFIPFLLIACSAPSAAGTSVPVDDFAARMSDPAQLIDVRSREEFASGHIPSALNMDWNAGDLEARAGELDKSRPVLLYCASGRRSAEAREFLIEHGFNNVVDLEGGIQAWSSAARPLEH